MKDRKGHIKDALINGTFNFEDFGKLGWGRDSNGFIFVHAVVKIFKTMELVIKSKGNL